jgi:hypothetical protein
MPSPLTPRPRFLSRTHCVAAWICAISLVVVLVNRFPRTASNEQASWARSTPSHLTAKVMAKDFFVLQPPPAVRILLPRFAPVRVEISEERPLVPIALDNRLFTRPPPSA